MYIKKKKISLLEKVLLLSNIEELKILNINRLSSSQENINNHIIKLSNLELDKEYNSKSCLGSLVNFIINVATTNETSAAKNTPNTMCKNSPLGAFKQYTMNEPGEAGLLNRNQLLGKLLRQSYHLK